MNVDSLGAWSYRASSAVSFNKPLGWRMENAVSHIPDNAEVTLDAAGSSDLKAIVDLLAANGLPVADVGHHINAFVIAKHQNLVVGTVGAEYYGEVGLLRSLCVLQSRRKVGTGRRLLSAIESIAATRGVRDLFLLTTGAATYFSGFGFEHIAREVAPIEIQQMLEWSSLCPSSAICLHKRLGAAAYYLPNQLLSMREEIPGARMWAVKLQHTMLTYYEVAPGVHFETHQHACEQITTVVEGELFFETRDGVCHVGPGEVIAIPPEVPHAVFTKTISARAFDSWSTPFP